MKKAKLFVETYGCQMNVYDSELATGILLKDTCELTDRIEQADVILVNTCAIRENAEQRVLGRLDHYLGEKRKRPGTVIGVLGCMAKHLDEKIRQDYPFVDFVAGPDSYRRLPELVRRNSQETVLDTELNRLETYDYIWPHRGVGTNAWVAISRGCDNFCTFCVVPYTRGRERSRSVDSIVGEVRQVAAEGYSEITLLGQNVNSYRHEHYDFPALLEAVSQVDGIRRIRYTSPHPKDLSDRLLEVMRDNPKVMNHIHLPFQAGSDRILDLMARGYTAEEFIAQAEKARRMIPDLGLSTDIIVGFPTETEEEFEATLELVRRVEFDSAFTFKYSERDGTRAQKLYPDDISDVVKGERLERLIALQKEISRRRNSTCIGSETEVLVEGPSARDPEEWMGRTGSNRVVVFPRRSDMNAGDLVMVRINDLSGFTLRAVLID